jgi:hypothetical protein
MPLRDPPSWWDWELTFTRHAERRMQERGVTEVALRAMLRWAVGLRPSELEGRFVVETKHERRVWEVIVEPDEELQRIAVVTVYTRK